jgi:hypothetical protein
MHYQDVDREIIDYGLVQFPGSREWIRGPLPRSLDDGGYLAFLGAAQTFGRFALRPFPTLVGESLGHEVLNLGFAGAGPKEFLRHRRYIEAANRARLVVVQVLSARSIENSHFDNPNADMLRQKGNPDAKPRHSEPAYDELLKTHSRSYVEALVAETRGRYVEEMCRLLRAIEVPKVLFWFSRRGPDYEERYDFAGNLFGHFPQFVNREMIEELARNVDLYCECVTSRGLPQPLISRFTGQPVTLNLGPAYPHHNNYYPSPEMQEDAARALAEAVGGRMLM